LSADKVDKKELAAELSGMDDKELKDMLDKLYREEEKVSYRRRIIHGKIDVLRVELVRRLKTKQSKGEKLFTRSDIDRLSEILAGEAAGTNVTSDPDEELF
jgi:hypothetical protein